MSHKEAGRDTDEAQGREGPGKAGMQAPICCPSAPLSPPAHILCRARFQPQCGLHGGLQLGRVGDIER